LIEKNFQNIITILIHQSSIMKGIVIKNNFFQEPETSDSAVWSTGGGGSRTQIGIIAGEGDG
jgi:hypothetical protein